MAEKDKFAQREHWLEEEYFGRKNQELIEKLRERREREADRQKMAEMMSVDDQDVLKPCRTWATRRRRFRCCP